MAALRVRLRKRHHAELWPAKKTKLQPTPPMFAGLDDTSSPKVPRGVAWKNNYSIEGTTTQLRGLADEEISDGGLPGPM